MLKKNITKEFLLENINRTNKDIANDIGCSEKTIKRYYRLFDIKKNNFKDSFFKIKEEFLIENINRSNKDIANDIGCSESTIKEYYRKYNIKKRDFKKQ